MMKKNIPVKKMRRVIFFKFINTYLEFESDWEYDTSVCKTLQLSQISNIDKSSPKGKKINYIKACFRRSLSYWH